MGNLTINEDKNFISGININNAEYKINDEGARNVIKSIQISLDNEYVTPTGSQLKNSPAIDDKFQEAIQKLNNGMVEYEAIHANALNLFSNELNKINHLSSGYNVEEVVENNVVPESGDTIQEGILKLHKSILDLETIYANLYNDLNDKMTSILTYNSGNSTSNDVSKIPTSKKLCIVETNNSGTLQLSNDLDIGNELHCIIINTGTSAIKIEIPEEFKHKNESNEINIDNDNYIELNIISTSNGLYLINS